MKNCERQEWNEMRKETSPCDRRKLSLNKPVMNDLRVVIFYFGVFGIV